MPLQDFQAQSQQALQSGLRMGGALQNAQTLQQQRAFNEQINPLKIEQAQLQNTGLRAQQAQQQEVNPLLIQQEQLKNENIQRDNLRKELTQDAVMLASYDEETGKKIIPQLIEKYKDNPQVIEGFNKLYATTGREYVSANLQALSMLTGKPIGAKAKSTGKIAELEGMGLVQGTPEFQDAMRKLVFKDAEGKTSLKASDIKGINADVTALTSDYKGVYKSAKDLEKLGSMDSAPAQMAMVFKFMKALDPQSVVREGEFAQAAASAGMSDRAINYLTKLDEGKFLNKDQIKEFVNVAKQMSNSRAEGVAQSVAGYLEPYGSIIDEDRKRAFQDRAGVKMFDIAKQEAVVSQFPNAPAVGTVQDGFKYNGGDPAVQASWSAI